MSAHKGRAYEMREAPGYQPIIPGVVAPRRRSVLLTHSHWLNHAMLPSPDAVLSQEGVVIHNSAREVAPLRRPPHIDAPPHQLVGEKRPGALCEERGGCVSPKGSTPPGDG